MSKSTPTLLILFGLLLTPMTGSAQQQFVWENVSLGLSTSDLTALTVLPDDPNVVLVGGSGMVFRTDDGGDSWRLVLRIGSSRGKTASPSEGDQANEDGRIEEDTEQVFRELFEDVESKYGTAYADSIATQLRSQAEEQARDDQRQRQRQAQVKEQDALAQSGSGEDRRIRRIIAVRDVPGLVYICTERGLFRSTNAGVDFDRVTLPLSGKHRIIEDVLYMAEGTIAIATQAGIIIRLQNGQSFLASMPNGNQPVYTLLWHKPSARILAGTDRGLVASQDFGSTFQTLYVPMSAKSRRINDLASPGTQTNLVLAATGQGLIRSLDGGMTFEPTWTTRLGTGSAQKLASVGERQELHVATPSGVFRTSDAGTSLVELGAGLTDPNVRAVSSRVFGGRLILWIATSSGAFRYIPRVDVKLSRKVWLLLGKHKLKDPSLSLVMDEATRHAHLSMNRGAKMERNVRLRSLAPRVRFSHRRAYERNENKIFPIDPQIPFLGERVTVVPGDIDTRLEVFLELRDLIFDPQEPLIESHRRQVRRKRNRFRHRIARVFMSRQRILLQILGNKKKRGRAFRKRIHRFEALTAILDALTGYRLTWAKIDPLVDAAQIIPEPSKKLTELRDPAI